MFESKDIPEYLIQKGFSSTMTSESVTTHFYSAKVE